MKNYLYGFTTGVVMTLLCVFVFLNFTKTHQYNQQEKKSVDNKDANKIQVADDKTNEAIQREVSSVEPAIKKIPPPKFHAKLPVVLETKEPGEFKVQWDPVPGAEKYRVFLYDQNGNEVKTTSTRLNYIFVQNIPFKGTRKDEVLEYSVRIASGTIAGEFYDKGDKRKVLVYRDHLGIFNSLVAPEIKAIVTED